MKFVALSIIVVLFCLPALSCPLGAKEDHLTIQRVMINFGRYFSPAEMIAYRGQNKNEKITDEQIREAIEKLSVVVNCASSVIDNPKGDLIPQVARFMSEDKRAAYMDTFVYMMEDFRLNVLDYQAAYIALLAQPPEQRDFSKLYELTKRQNSFIDRAHAKL